MQIHISFNAEISMPTMSCIRSMYTFINGTRLRLGDDWSSIDGVGIKRRMLFGSVCAGPKFSRVAAVVVCGSSAPFQGNYAGAGYMLEQEYSEDCRGKRADHGQTKWLTT